MTKFLFEELAFSDNFRQSSTKKSFFVVVIFLALITIGYLFDIRFLGQHFFTLEHEYTQLQQQLMSHQKKTSDLSAQRSTINQLRNSFNDLHQQMPAASDNQKLLNNILQAGQVSGIQFNMIKPQPIQQQDFYAILPLQISVTGKYSQFIEFITLLNQLNILMTFPEFTLTHSNPHLSTAMDSAPGNADKLILNMTINVYTSN